MLARDGRSAARPADDVCVQPQGHRPRGRVRADVRRVVDPHVAVAQELHARQHGVRVFKVEFQPDAPPALTARNTRLKNWSNVKSPSTARWHDHVARGQCPRARPRCFPPRGRLGRTRRRAANHEIRLDHAARLVSQRDVQRLRAFTPCAQRHVPGNPCRPKCVPRLPRHRAQDVRAVGSDEGRHAVNRVFDAGGSAGERRLMSAYEEVPSAGVKLRQKEEHWPAWRARRATRRGALRPSRGDVEQHFAREGRRPRPRGFVPGEHDRGTIVRPAKPSPTAKGACERSARRKSVRPAPRRPRPRPRPPRRRPRPRVPGRARAANRARSPRGRSRHGPSRGRVGDGAFSAASRSRPAPKPTPRRARGHPQPPPGIAR